MMDYQPGVVADAMTAYAAALHEGTEVKVDNREYAIAAQAFLVAEGVNVVLVPPVAPADHQRAMDLFADGYRAMSS
jgi:hypothetical protein